MAIITEYERGDTARFNVVFFDEDDNAIEPDVVDGDRDVSIEIKDLSADEIIVEDEQMEELSETEFQYDWQTTEGMSLGEYEVEARGVFDGDTALNRDRINLVRTKEHR